ncbi:MAG: glycosyltransferase family 1 protein [Microcoleus sp. SIO2G3]|nr:glycosyltransferase family 1 protein [Microcoleus sp. SIO2G3]
MKALILGNAKFTGPDLISPAQLYPFFDNRAKLRQTLNLTFEHCQADTFAEIEAASAGAKVDAIFMRPSWKESPEEGERVLSKLKQENPDRKLIFLDPWDQVNTRFFNVLPYVDRLLKYQRLKDVTRYTQPLAGGTAITDYLAKELNYDIGDWYVGSEVPAGYESRIGTSWNVTLIKRFKQELMRKRMIWQPKVTKDIDIFCRVSYGVRGSQDWYGRYRQAAIAAIEPLGQHYNLAVNGEYVGEKVIPSRQYFNEIRRSRIVVSPFGWGETTWRDYEAV